MLPATLLAKKRDGGELTWEEIQFLIEGFVAGRVADYQMSAFAMAVVIRGMTPDETAALTLAMLDSGDRLEVGDESSCPRVDKHSTGGLGDKVSLILAPLLACHGVQVPMISGRGLGLTGGTLDKLEAIPGFRTTLDRSAREWQLQRLGCFIIGASERIAPADRRLYALRDVTGTVESIPLITASILSKKLAGSLDRLVMDVKVGSAAFMKTVTEATALARSLVATGRRLGLGTTALLTDMDQPLGRAIGNAIEVNESWEVLTGGGPPEVGELTVRLAAQALVDSGRAESIPQASENLWRSLGDGTAAERFEQLIAAQGGKWSGPLRLAPAADVTLDQSGHVAGFDCERLGRCVVEMGGGRSRAEDRIDPTVGLEIFARIGDRVERGQTWLRVHGHDPTSWIEPLRSAIRLVDHPLPPRALVLDTLTGET